MNAMPTNHFKRTLASGKRQIGLWVTFAYPPITEVLADSGFDWLLLDMEHSPTDLETVGRMLLAARGGTTAPIVRVPILDMGWIKRVLDAGAPNIMVPNIRSAAEARQAVSFTRFPPQGERGVAGSTRAAGFTRYKDYMARANDEVGVILQIESREALAELDAICRVPGVDAVFIGPADLAAALGHRGNPGHAEVQATIRQAYATARAASCAIGILVADGKAQPHLDAGATMVGVGTDVHLLIAGADAVAAKFVQR
jgi:2-keto-3-deoxy-L-rhamnonate aldolase RhmA